MVAREKDFSSRSQMGGDAQERAATGSEPSGAFTPGPWVASEVEASFAIMAGEYPRVAYAHNNPGHEHQTAANARLIAAAPELYEALKELDELRVGCDPDELGAICGQRIVGFVEKYRAALAKAEGRS